MKQVININYHGRIIPIEVSAHDLLKNYIETLNLYFNDETGKEEIINDIENRIGELFQERLKNGANCITDDDVNAVIKSMGTPEDFDLKDDNTEKQTNINEANKSTDNKSGKRLFRNENNKMIGGVCAGLAAYFNIDITIVRLLFVVMFLSFGFGLLPYIVLWIVVPNSTQGQIGAVKKKLYRDGEHKLIGGVCSGISEFFGIEVWIPRVLFLLPLFGIVIGEFGEWNHFDNFLPGSFIAYLICWIVLPEAKTTSEKLEMKGEKIDLNSIKNTINEEMKGVGERVKKAGEDIKQQAEEKSKGFFGDLFDFTAKVIRGAVRIFILIIKFFIYSILVCIGLAVLISLFGLSVSSVALFPLKDFFLNGYWQNLFAGGTLLFFILLGLVAFMVWLIKKIVGIKTKNKWLTTTFITLWVLGWICLFGLMTTIGKDFSSLSHRNKNETEIKILQPANETLLIEMKKNSPFDPTVDNIDFFDWTDYFNDSFYLGNVKLTVIRSLDDSFHLRVVKTAHGRSRSDADTTAANIKFSMTQKDSLITINQGFFLTKKDKFRNQQVDVLLSVPEGKRIRMQKLTAVSDFENENWEFEINDDNPALMKEFQMTNSGLVPIEEIKKSRNFSSPTDSTIQNDRDSQLQLKQKLESEINDKKRVV